MLELSAHPIAHHCAANLTPDHETSSRSGKRTVSTLGTAGLDLRVRSCVVECKVDDKPRASRPPTRPHGRGEVGALAQPGRGRKHGKSRFRATSGRKALTALPTASGEDGAAGASAHAQPKAVGLCAPAVVRLERALTHSGAPRKRSSTAVGEECAGRRSEGTPTVRAHRRHGQTWSHPITERVRPCSRHIRHSRHSLWRTP
jgi:hypothetical protein